MSIERRLFMSAPKPDQPQNGVTILEGDGGVIFIFDGPGDTTIKPRPPEIPPYSPRAIPPGLLRTYLAEQQRAARQTPPPAPEKGDATSPRDPGSEADGGSGAAPPP
jgi:hypothetical protein